MGFLALGPVCIDPVNHCIGDGYKSGLLQVLAQIVNIVGDDPILSVHIGFMGEDVQRTGGVQLHGQRNVPCLRLRLLQQLFPNGTEGGNDAGELLFLADLRHAAVNNGFLVRTDAIRIHLLQKGHDKLGLERHRAAFTVAAFHVHGVEPISAAHGKANHRATQRLYQRRILSFRVQNDNIVLTGQGCSNNQKLCEEGFTGAGNAQQHHGLVQKIIHVAENQIMGYGIFPDIDTARFLNLLHLERNKRC